MRKNRLKWVLNQSEFSGEFLEFMFLFLSNFIPNEADKDLVLTTPPKMHLVTLVVRAAKQRSPKGMKFPPSHWSVVFQNSRTAKISRWKGSFEVFLMPLSLAWAKQASEPCSVPNGTLRRRHNQNGIRDSTQWRQGSRGLPGVRSWSSETQA